MQTTITNSLRPVIGDFSSIICTKAIVVGVENALGERAAHVALIAAGRGRGRQIAEAAVGRSEVPLSDLPPMLNHHIGAAGTRLCTVEKIEEEGKAIRVYLSETLCSAGEPQGSPRNLTFTLGAIQGVLEVVTGRALKGRQIGSVLRGQDFDILEFNDRI